MSSIRKLIVGCNAAAIRGGSRGWGWFNRAVKEAEKGAAAIQPYDAVCQKLRPESTPSSRPQAFLDISIDGNDAGKLVVELASDVVPETVQRFQDHINNGYAGTLFHQISNDRVLITGRPTSTESDTVVKPRFKDENFALQYSESGVLGMANSGVDSQTSEFFITMKPMPHLNGKYVAFGKVISGMDTAGQKINNVFSVGGRPLSDVKVKSCGNIV